MSRIAVTSRLAMVTMTGLIFCSMVTAGEAVADPAELKVLTSVALSAALDQIGPEFERATGHKLAIGYGLIADLRKRILDGETADIIILSRPVMEELQQHDKLGVSGLVNVAGTEVAVAARAGVPKPDISSVDAFMHTLLSARSIVYADPAKGGASGVYFARVIDRLGIAEQLRGKTILVPGAQAAAVVAKGEAELGIGQASEIVPVSGAQVIGPLPGELASTTMFTAGIGAGAQSPDAAKAFVEFLTGSGVAPLWKAKGFAPG